MNECCKNKLTRSSLKCAGHVEKWEMNAVRECVGRTAFRGIWREWEENGKQQQKIGVGDW